MGKNTPRIPRTRKRVPATVNSLRFKSITVTLESGTVSVCSSHCHLGTSAGSVRGHFGLGRAPTCSTAVISRPDVRPAVFSRTSVLEDMQPGMIVHQRAGGNFWIFGGRVRAAFSALTAMNARYCPSLRSCWRRPQPLLNQARTSRALVLLARRSVLTEITPPRNLRATFAW